MKPCIKCGVPKELAEYYPHPAMADGHLNTCKACKKAERKSHYRTSIDRCGAYELERNQRPDRIAKQTRYSQKARERYPEKYAARTAVGNAVRDGKLVKPKLCQRCGKSGNIHAHHEDYSKPLEVIWLCTGCHAKEHKRSVLIE